ncbi:MAG: serine/threonine protein kinase, partial [Myxococcales bacterium]|nr:serine/threonine protein kinase [Myxococcales bacterium]
YQKRFLREARVVAALRHPNIVSVLDLGNLEDGTLFLAMEYVDGMPLNRLLSTGPMPVDRALHILEQVANALNCAHTHGVLHRDLKPANVMVVPIPGDSYHAKLIDFGILKHFSVGRNAIHDGVSEVVTSPAAVVGTPDYMAPEQILQHKLDGRADIYALGVMAYEMLVGKRPFAADNYGDLMLQQLHAKPAPILALRDGTSPSSAFETALLRALAKDPSQRPASAPEYIELLRSAYINSRRENKSKIVAALRTAATMVIPAIVAAIAMYWFLRAPGVVLDNRAEPDGHTTDSPAVPVAVVATHQDRSDTVDVVEPPAPATHPFHPTPQSADQKPDQEAATAGQDGTNPVPTFERRKNDPPEERSERYIELAQVEFPPKKGPGHGKKSSSDTAKRRSVAKSDDEKMSGGSASPVTAESPQGVETKASVSISVKPFGNVQFASGQTLVSPVRSAMLSQGKHRITAIHPSLGKYTTSLSIDPGKTYLVLIDMYAKSHEVRQQ